MTGYYKVYHGKAEFKMILEDKSRYYSKINEAGLWETNWAKQDFKETRFICKSNSLPLAVASIFHDIRQQLALNEIYLDDNDGANNDES